MKIRNVVPVFAVRDIGAAKEFYSSVLGFEVAHKDDWYLHLKSRDEESVKVGFVASNHPVQPSIFQPVFDGKGAYLSLEVEDVDTEYESLTRSGVPIKLEKRTEPWGETHFAIIDPNGVIVNIYHTDASKRGEVSFKEHMMQKEKGIHR